MLKKASNWSRNPYNILLFLILLLSAFMRLYRIRDYMTFLGDEGRDVLVVYGILHGHLTLLGPTASVGGFFFGPFYYYFMAPWLWLFHYDPVGPAVGVALISIVTVWLIYEVGKQFFNSTTGLIAAGLYAIAPVVLNYSRSSWNPNLMPFFSILTIYCVYKGLLKNQKLLLLIAGVCLGIAIQLHYIELFVGASVFFIVLFFHFVVFRKGLVTSRITASIVQYIIIGIGYIIGWSPFLLFELRHNFSNTRSIYTFIFHSGDVKSGGHYFAIVADVFFRLFGRLVTAFPPSDQIAAGKHPNAPLWMALTWILALAAVGFILWRLYKFYYQKKEKETFFRIGLVTIWFFTELLLFGLYKKNIYDYYFESMFMVPFWFVGFLVSYLLSQKLWFKITGGAVLLSLIAINLNGIPFRYQPNKQLQQTEDISRFVFDKTDGKPFNFALITGGNSDHAYRYFFTLWGRPSVIIQNPQVDPKRTSVTDQLLVVCESLPCYPLGNSLFEVAGFGRGEIVGHWPVSVVEVYKLRHYTGKG